MHLRVSACGAAQVSSGGSRGTPVQGQGGAHAAKRCKGNLRKRVWPICAIRIHTAKNPWFKKFGGFPLSAGNSPLKDEGRLGSDPPKLHRPYLVSRARDVGRSPSLDPAVSLDSRLHPPLGSRRSADDATRSCGRRGRARTWKNASRRPQKARPQRSVFLISVYRHACVSSFRLILHALTFSLADQPLEVDLQACTCTCRDRWVLSSFFWLEPAVRHVLNNFWRVR